jgi:transcriptional regulator MftR-like protein
MALVRLVRQTPSLRAQEHITREQTRLGIAEALGHRLGVDAERDARPHIVASIALAPLDAAFEMWFGARSGEDICGPGGPRRRSAGLLDALVGAGQAVLVLAAYSLVFIAGSMLIVRRRDIT